MNRHERALRALLDALVVHAGGGCAWFGRRVDLGGAGAAPPPRGAAVFRLRELLYSRFYVPGGAVPISGTGGRGSGEPGEFATRLVGVALGASSRQPGWRVVSVDAADITIEQDGLRLRADPAEVVGDPRGGLTVGEVVDLRVPSVVESAQPGFLVVLGERTLANRFEARLDRFYWHVKPAAAALLVTDLATILNRRSIRFRLKAPAHADAYLRCDAVTLYVRGRDRDLVTDLALETRERMATRLSPATPALTHRLADGLALAEEPTGGASFGEHRCGLLAEALLAAAEAGATGQDARLAVIRDRFASEGIDADHPWRGALAP